MAAEWYCRLMGSDLGPFTTEQLIEMARKHQIEPIDLIRKGSDGKWVPASRAKGLFERAAAPPEPVPSTEEIEPQELWYYLSQGEKFGPMSSEELEALARDAKIKPNDRVWSNINPKWTLAKELDWLETS